MKKEPNRCHMFSEMIMIENVKYLDEKKLLDRKLFDLLSRRYLMK